VLAAVVIPANIASRLSSVTSQGQVEVIYNGEALEQSFVHSTIEAALAQANLELSEQIRQLAGRVIGALVRGGGQGVPGAPQGLPSLTSIPGILRGVQARQPPGANRVALGHVAEFAEFAARNLGRSQEVLTTIGRSGPQHVAPGATADAYAVVVAVSISPMFVCVLPPGSR
jgi:hypothetical protein